MTMQERFTSRYRGKRYSFGYPACPNLEDQQGIWKLLRPEEIGVAADRRLHDGPGSQRQRAGVPSPRLRLLQRGSDGLTSAGERHLLHVDLLEIGMRGESNVFDAPAQARKFEIVGEQRQLGAE